MRAGRPPVRSRRQLIDGIGFRVRTGVPWRDAPVEYGPWGRVHDRFRRWQRNGTWQRILTRLQSLADAKGAITWDPNHVSPRGAYRKGHGLVGIDRPKRHRAAVTRYDQLAVRYEATVLIAAVNEWL